MGCGFFGKLPMRGDFVSRDCPAGFLEIWEPFLLAGMRQARLDLKEAWEEAYMTMPVWRFFIKPLRDLSPLETAVAGAVMPNVDRVGRKFPLALVSVVDPGRAGGFPSRKWCDQVENTLLATLGEDTGFEEFLDTVSRIEPPEMTGDISGTSDAFRIAAATAHAGQLETEFWTEARGACFRYQCHGMPEAAAFKWLLRPELTGHGAGPEAVGDVHGQSREDLQT